MVLFPHPEGPVKKSLDFMSALPPESLRYVQVYTAGGLLSTKKALPFYPNKQEPPKPLLYILSFYMNF
jgi:hypothetical protein